MSRLGIGVAYLQLSFRVCYRCLYSTATTPRLSAALFGEQGGVAERSAFGGLASSKVGLLKILKKSGASEDFGTINQVRAVSSRINPSEQYKKAKFVEMKSKTFNKKIEICNYSGFLLRSSFHLFPARWQSRKGR